MKTIIFDIDGTIFDTKQGIIDCLNDVLNCFGCNKISKENEDSYIGPPIKESLMKLNGFSDEEAAEATQQYREKYVAKYVENSIPYDHLRELLVCLKNHKYRVCIATMKTKSQVEKLLDIFGIIGFFDRIEVAREDGGYTKYDMLENIKSSFPKDDFMFIGEQKGIIWRQGKHLYHLFMLSMDMGLLMMLRGM